MKPVKSCGITLKKNIPPDAKVLQKQVEKLKGNLAVEQKKVSNLKSKNTQRNAENKKLITVIFLFAGVTAAIGIGLLIYYSGIEEDGGYHLTESPDKSNKKDGNEISRPES